MIENLTESASQALEEVYKQMDEIVKQIPDEHSIAHSQFVLVEPEYIEDSSIKGKQFWVEGKYKLSYDKWSFMCAYKEVFTASMNDGVPLKMISVVLRKDGDTWKKDIKFQTVQKYNDLENALSKIDEDMKTHLQEEVVKKRENWNSSGYYALPKNDFRINTKDKELLIEEPTEKMLDLKRKVIDIYNSFGYELTTIFWNLTHNAPPDDFYRTDYYI